MRLGIFAKTFAGNDPEAVLRQSAEAGFEGVQYNMACSGLAAMPDAIPSDVAQAVAAAAAATAQPVFAVSGTYNMIHPDVAVRRDGERRLKVIAAACAALGTKVVTLCTGTRDPQDQWRHHPDNASPEAWRDLLSAFEVAVGIAESHGVMLGVEPELANVVSSAAAARRLMDEMKSDAIGIVLDPANLAEEATPDERRRGIAEAVDTLAGRIIIAHAKDRTATGEVAAPGQGAIDFAHFLSALRASCFDGPLVAHGFGAGEARDVADFLHRQRAALP
ncbi:sugar phosphate isomerase/epimerase family protein [Aestuariivirga sp.]|uniref:sugar phosphate isomerase/epimerase family protein n=1 Tax=Aestuariivirga sp. TaxID=2650926 RepID=UPI0039E22DDC